MERRLTWDGARNVRDLGGLRTRAGARTQPRRLIRSASLDGLSASGWAALWDHGVRTVIDLRDPDEARPDVAPRPSELTTISLPLDGSGDTEFWDAWKSGPQFGTPMYYRPHLDRMPERSAAVISAIAGAEPGGVVFHCAGGRDRSGQITLLVLALAGVAPEEIADDYGLSEGDDGAAIAQFLAERGTSGRQLVLDTLADLDVERRLAAAGASRTDMDRVRRRLLETAAWEHPAP